MRLAFATVIAALAQGAPSGGPTFVPPTGGGGKAELTFPSTGDTAVIAKDPHMWNEGDSIEGVRETSLRVATALVGTWTVRNFLDPSGHLQVAVRLNGVKIGSFVVTDKNGTSVPIDLHFPAVSGPKFTLRYEVTANVESGAGSIQTTWGDSKLTLQ